MTTPRETPSVELHPIIIKASGSRQNWRIEFNHPLISIRVRMIQILKVPSRKSMSHAAYNSRLQRILTRIPSCPSSASHIIPLVPKLITAIAKTPNFSRWRPRSLERVRNVNFIRIAPASPATPEFPVHRIFRIISIAGVDDTFEGLHAVALVEVSGAVAELNAEAVRFWGLLVEPALVFPICRFLGGFYFLAVGLVVLV